jgi:hypothetical protein
LPPTAYLPLPLAVGKASQRVGLAAIQYNHFMSIKRFNELQDDFFETSKRLRLAQTTEDKLEMLDELQRIARESKKALRETGSKSK